MGAPENNGTRPSARRRPRSRAPRRPDDAGPGDARTARHRVPGATGAQRFRERLTAFGRSGAGALAVAAAVLALGLIGAVFSATTQNPGNVYTADQLNAYVPTAATASRTASTTCLVSWTPVASPPSGMTYDVTDGSGTTVATGVSGTSTSITVPATAVTPTVKARLGSWVSSSATATSAPCNGFPDAPVVTLTPSDGAVAASWPAPAGNGGTVASYTATISPAPGTGSATCTVTAPTTACSWSSLTNGLTYTVSVTATSNVGTGPAGTATAVPYPSTIMSSSALQAWYDAAMPSTMLATSCSGSTATSTVGCWKDRSGKGNDVSGGVAPGLDSSAFPGRSVPSFTGTQYLTRASGFPTSADYSEFAVYRLTSTSCFNNLVSGDGTGHALYAPYGNALSLYHNNSQVYTLGYGAATGTSYVGSATYAESGRAGVVAVNGTVVATGSVAYSNANAGIQLGAYAGGSNLCGQLAEVAVLNRTLTATERRTVEDYLSRKWSVTISPGQPTGVAATTADSQSTVSWTAPYDGGSSITSYTVTAVPSDGTVSTVTLSCASSPCTVTGLTNGVTYSVTVTANSAAGAGLPSSAVTVTPQPALLTGANAVLWLDGKDVDGDGTSEGPAESCDTSTSCTSLSNVLKRWVDKTGGGHDAVQSTTAMAGTYTPATGLVTFTGNGYYQTATGVPTGPGVTAFVVASSATSTFNTYGWFAGGRAANGWVLHPNQTGTSAKFFGITSGGYNLQTTNGPDMTPSTAITNPHVWDGQISGGTSYQTLDTAVDGVVGATATSGTTRAAANVVLTLGADDFDLANRRGQGALREVLVFKTALTAAERATIRDYLAHKWSAPVVPGAPTGVSAAASSTTSGQASVSWTAPTTNGGSPVTGYTATATPAAGSGYAALSPVTCTAATSPCTLSGLIDGITYSVTVAATNAAGTGATSSAATVITYPATVMTGSALKLWLDGADPSTILASSGCSGAAATTTVGCWVDKSTSADNATQSTGGSQPALTTVSSRSVPMFDGSTSSMTLSATTLPSGTTPSSTFIALATTEASPASSNYRTALSWGTASPGLMRSYQKLLNSSQIGVVTHSGVMSAGGSLTTGATGILSDAWTSSAYTGFWNGVSGTTVTAGTTTGTATAVLGAITGPAAFWQGPIAEVAVVQGSLTTSQRRAVEEYLARKWGVVITPAAPTAVTATAGTNSATVSWTAPSWNGGAAVTSYTVTASNGATCTSATTSCTVTGLPGGTYTFTVTATNSVGTGPASAASSSVLVPSALYVWGDASSARTGVAMQNSTTTTPVRMPGPESWSQVSLGENDGCAITSAGALYCWGVNSYGALGVGDTTNRWEPAQVSGGGTWSAVDAGEYTTCGIKTDQSLWCWGYGATGEMGNGTTTLTNSSPVAVTTTGTTTWSKVSVGWDHVCGLKTDQTVWCWGNGGLGRLGNGGTTSSSTPVQASAGTTFTAVSAGYTSTCAIRASDSAALCWGDGAYGGLGNGGTTSSSTAVAVSGGLAFASISVADNYACGVTTSNALYCWGYNAFGQLGDASTTNRTSPVRESTSSSAWATAPLTGASASSPAMFAWEHHTCAVRTTGALYCWGYNGSGQLGDGTVTSRSSPTQVGSLTTWTSVSGSLDGTCGLRTDAALWCTGNDGSGQLGQYYGNSVGSPTPVLPPSSTFSAASTGWQDGCGVRSDGTLWCWGTNTNGIEGDGTTTSRWSPVQAGSASTWQSVSVGTYTVCGTRTDGSLWCWGYAGFGGTGISGASGNVTTPTAGPAGTWSSVSVGEQHTCAVKTDGTLWCWGENSHGDVGDGTTTNRTTPVQVTATGVTTWASVSAGYYTTCAVAATGTYAGGLFCWGYNLNGQVGDGTTTDRTSPTRIGSASWWNVVSGRGHTCGVQTSGTLWCWGYNNNSQLGDGTTTTRTSPVQVGSATTWAQATAGYEFSCARRTDATLWCWGNNLYRQLGDRDTTTLTTPSQVPGVTVSSLGDTHTSARTTVALS